MDDFAKIILAAVVFSLLGIAVCNDVSENEQKSAECTKKHCADGSHPMWHKPYRSQGVCICSGVID